MAEFYNIESNQKAKNVTECNPFDAAEQTEVNEQTSTYMEVLNIFREALSYVDITKIIKKL